MINYRLLLLGILLITACNPRTHVQSVRGSYIQINNTIEIDSTSNSMIEPYKIQLGEKMNTVIGENAIAMTNGEPESTLGNFISDLCIEWINNSEFGKADICLLNKGGLRSDLPQGNITTGNIYELMPFDNTMVLVEISGNNMKQLVSYLRSVNGQPASGLELTKTSATINGNAINSDKTYTVLTSNYLASGGDKMTFFLEPIKTTPTDVLLRDVIIMHYEKLNKTNSKASSSLYKRLKP